jgi:hypothetical protein
MSLPPWLRLPSLAVLVIDGLKTPDLPTKSQKIWFAQQIYESCPTLRTFSFGLLHTPIVQWLAEDESEEIVGTRQVLGLSLEFT